MTDPDYFSLTELNTLPQMSDPKYSDARKLAAAAWVTGIIERECKTSFVPRAKTVTLSGAGCATLMLPDPWVRSLTSVTVGGTSLDVSGLTYGDGILAFTGNGTWARGTRNVVVTYVSGYSTTPPGDVKDAALVGTRYRLLATNANSVLDSRQRSVTNDAGTITLQVAGKDNPTGWPDVDATIIAWRDQLDVFGFA